MATHTHTMVHGRILILPIPSRRSARTGESPSITLTNVCDPEGLFCLSRHLAHCNELGPALELLEQVVARGYCCVPAMDHDRWLDPLRKKPAFTRLQRRAAALDQQAVAAFERLGGRRLLGLASSTRFSTRSD